MRLNFLINKKYIFLQAMNARQPDEPFRGWANFIIKKWRKYPQECYLLAGFAEWPLLDKIPLKIIATKAEQLLEEWLKTPESKRLVKETEQYCNWLKKEWKEKGEKALDELEDIIRTPLPDKKISIYVTHPKLKNGLSVSPEIIVWGHKEEWTNYSVVYLCHEILHIIFWGDNSACTHAIIELATDQELRVRLSKNKKYLTHLGHKDLLKIEKRLLPSWKKYLKNSKQNLKQFIEIQRKKSANETLTFN